MIRTVEAIGLAPMLLAGQWLLQTIPLSAWSLWRELGDGHCGIPCAEPRSIRDGRMFCGDTWGP